MDINLKRTNSNTAGAGGTNISYGPQVVVPGLAVCVCDFLFYVCNRTYRNYY